MPGTGGAGFADANARRRSMSISERKREIKRRRHRRKERLKERAAKRQAEAGKAKKK